MSENNRHRLSQNQQRWIVKRITLNKSHKEIQAEFTEKFSRTISSVTLTRLKRKHSLAITSHQMAIVEAGAVQAASLKNQSYRLLERRMNAAEADETHLEKLRRELQTGEITRKEYEWACRAYINLSVSDLTSIANMAQSHTKGEDDPNAGPQDSAALDILLEGIRSGNAVQLVQVLNPTINNHLA